MTQTETRLRPRDDRTWPRGAAPFSAVVVLAALTTFAVLLVVVPGPTKLVVALAFLAVAAMEAPAYLAAMRHVLEGHRPPRWTHLAQLALAIAALVGAEILREVGIAMFAGLFGAMFAANLWSIRAARSNRAEVDEIEAEMARERREIARDDPPVREYADADVPQVGPLLDHILAVTLRNGLAWLVAGAVVLAGCLVLDAPEASIVGVVALGGGVLVWQTRRVLGAWLARRDFHRATTEPRRAYVVLLHDPTPRAIRPLLGVWSEEPVVSEGRLPKPEQVYRCDDDVDVLESHQGSVVVHEAWVDTGKRAGSKPRWVAADAGIALPHRRSLFGRWFMSSLIGAERPDHATPLTMPAPRPRSEAVTEVDPGHGSFVVKVAWRLAGLVAMALVFVWLT